MAGVVGVQLALPWGYLDSRALALPEATGHLRIPLTYSEDAFRAEWPIEGSPEWAQYEINSPVPVDSKS